MNWEALGAIGEVLGATAVFVTLAYLTVQVRHARREAVRNVSQSRTDAARDFNLTSALNERYVSISTKAHAHMGGVRNTAAIALVEQAGLTLEEATTFSGVQLARWQMQTQIMSNLADLSAGQRLEFDSLIRRAYDGSLPASALWYMHSKRILNPELVRYVDDLLAQAA